VPDLEFRYLVRPRGERLRPAAIAQDRFGEPSGIDARGRSSDDYRLLVERLSFDGRMLGQKYRIRRVLPDESGRSESMFEMTDLGPRSSGMRIRVFSTLPTTEGKRKMSDIDGQNDRPGIELDAPVWTETCRRTTAGMRLLPGAFLAGAGGVPS